MPYEKQTWKTGDVITETKLNHMEDGIANAGGVLIVNAQFKEDLEEWVAQYTLDKTIDEIYESISNGMLVSIRLNFQGDANQYLYLDDGGYEEMKFQGLPTVALASIGPHGEDEIVSITFTEAEVWKIIHGSNEETICVVKTSFKYFN